MEDVYCNPDNNNYEINISTEEWIQILSSQEIRARNNILDALEKFYLEPDHTFSCKGLSAKHGKTCNYYSVQNKEFGKMALRQLNRYRLISENGREIYWAVAWIELSNIKGVYTCKLRPELVSAIEESDIFDLSTDNDIQIALAKHNFRSYLPFVFTHQKRKKDEKAIRQGNSYKRSKLVADNALTHSEFKCEFDSTHKSFAREIDEMPYLETHHLIPLKDSVEFENSLDVPENVVCLCSMCHDCIHYGKDKRRIIEKLWRYRESDLMGAGITITLKKLLSFYGISDD